jgi:hypothetical protein
MKITDPKMLRELYDIEADWKLLIGYRFKGCLPTARKGNGHLASGHPVVNLKTKRRKA